MFKFKSFLFESMLLEDRVEFILDKQGPKIWEAYEKDKGQGKPKVKDAKGVIEKLADWSEKNVQWLVNALKLNEFLSEGILDTIKHKLGEFKGVVMSSIEFLLTRFKRHPSERLTTIETFSVDEISKMYEARVDTGAAVCSLHAEDIVIDKDEVSFKLAGSTYKLKLARMRETKSSSGITNRAIVKLTYALNGKTYSNIDTSLVDRSKLKFKLLVGRNLIAKLKLPVHVADNDELE